jgi:hypothetical protein
MCAKYSSVLIIGGNARKSGKTTFVCNVLNHFGKDKPLVALKITLYNDKKILQSHYDLEKEKEYHEIRETKVSGKKDSSRYVEAGAMEGWFIAAMDNESNSEKIMERIDFLLESSRMLIIESNRMRKKMDPGLFIMVNQKEKEDKSGAKAFQQMSDFVVEPDSIEFNEIQKYISIEKDNWVLKDH